LLIRKITNKSEERGGRGEKNRIEVCSKKTLETKRRCGGWGEPRGAGGEVSRPQKKKRKGRARIK